MLKDQATGINNKSSPIEIKRTAIEPSRDLGTLYNGFRDKIVEQLYLGNVENQSKSFNSPQCIITSGNENQNCNLLQLTNMTQELRLSVLLGLASKAGIASIIEHTRPINEFTRFLYYNYPHREEQLPDGAENLQKANKLSCPTNNDATHIITGITYGIEVIIVLQLPSDEKIASRIDHVLEKVRTDLNDGSNDLTLTAEEKNLLEKIDDTIVYSNISYLVRETTVFDICFCLARNKNKFVDTPIMYTLRPIKWMFPKYNGFGTNFIPLSLTISDEVEHYLIHLSNTVKSIKHCLDSNTTGLLRECLEEQLREEQRQWLKLKKIHEHIVDRLQKWILDIRKNRSGVSKKDQLFTHKDHAKFDNYAKNLQENVYGFEKKENLIIDLKEQHFEYCNVAELNLNKKNYKQTLKCKLKMNDRDKRILCTNDTLNKHNRLKLNTLRDGLAKEHETNPNLGLIYADFSYSSIELHDMQILTSSKKTNKEKLNTKKTSATQKIFTSQPSSFSSTINENINILLLGETGVGKSTFINAFVNYLKFKTFEQAQSNEPVVLMPVSFLITTGDNFEEHIVKFGDFDSLNNEDFDHPGESVTQHCKSYEFHLTNNDGKKLCIIDTPGFGDTRGLDQDDLNMQDILEYINNLTHLNAVCFLLKPNASELHTFFRMCFIQLIDLLGPNIRQNIIFCFTNARSTFYTPGDTAPLLKAMLKSLSMTDIPFKRENTFCFDNESFRYLVALQNSITFDDEHTNEYKMSWSTSVNQSIRLIDYICTQLSACPMHNDWKSIKNAEVGILNMIRPILEAMRNILRNIILCKMESPKKSIELYPKAIHRPATICLSCKSYPLQVGKFWVARDIPHEFLKKCLVCLCSTDQHIPINYVLNYEDLNSPSSHQQTEMIDMVYRLCLTGVEFDYFLSHVARSSKSDSFWIGLVRMITEENDLCENQKPNRLNLELVKDLTELKCKYEEQMEDLKSHQQPIELPVIYKRITTIREYPLIQEQLKAIKETQNKMADPYEVSQD